MLPGDTGRFVLFRTILYYLVLSAAVDVQKKTDKIGFLISLGALVFQLILLEIKWYALSTAMAFVLGIKLGVVRCSYRHFASAFRTFHLFSPSF